VALCQELGLDVRPADLGEYLSGVPDASLGAVTLSHVVEHLPYRLVIALLDEVLRALKPGGMLILETPNPQNIQVGAHTFYTDPTHRNPLPSSMLKFLVEARGFTGVQVLSLSPYPVGEAVPEDSELARRFNAYFYGAQDYAVIARKT
jgi:O-antigen chain-terminating methyltransferase